ncbi:MAG TPA: hypothetical protein VIV58_02035 [Kofleriaceae bacterium]
MQNISTDDLDSVTGGTTGAVPSTLPPHTLGTSNSSAGGLSSGVLTSLNSISDSIKGLSNNNNNGLNSNTMLMFGMALALRNRADSGPVVVNYSGGWGGGGWHGGFSWHAHW